MRLEIVVHCWRYSRLLTYQLSSVVLHPPATLLTLSVCYCPEDEKTAEVLDHFAEIARPAGAWLNPVPLTVERLCRRAIGRNQCALATAADWVWFTDCDHLFGAGCLDALEPRLAAVSTPLAFPTTTRRTVTQELGDAAIARVTRPGVYDVDPADFEPVRNGRAIGALQIVRGDVCRKTGYLNGHRRWQRPAATFQRCVEDVVFRRGHSGSTGIDVPNLYRIRHSTRGRVEIGVEL